MESLHREEFTEFFENTRIMRIHQIAFEQSRYQSIRDKLQANKYQKKVDAYIKRQVALQRTKQREIF